jgi:16S rRNA (guanine1207-N2)-methyltransferase
MAELALGGLLEPAGRMLVAGEADDALAEGLAARGAEVTRWHRFAAPGRRATPWPPETVADQAILRVPRGRASLDFALHGLATRLVPGGPLWLVGTNDEGIRSASRRMEELFEDVVTVDARRHGRLLRGRRRERPVGLRDSLDPWRAVGSIGLPGGERPWVTYPGLFARGELDPATAFLLEALPPFEPGARVLDFGCGAGTIGAALAQRGEVALDQLDADALAVEAARENLPDARTWLGSSLDDLTGAGPWDRVVTNPPIHESVLRSYRVLEQLARAVGDRLRPRGEAWLVAQRQVPVAEMFQGTDLRAAIADQRGAFRVWRAAR